MTPARSFVRSVLSRFHAARLPRPLAEASAGAVSASSLTPSVRQTRPRANEQWQHGTSAIFQWLPSEAVARECQCRCQTPWRSRSSPLWESSFVWSARANHGRMSVPPWTRAAAIICGGGRPASRKAANSLKPMSVSKPALSKAPNSQSRLWLNSGPPGTLRREPIDIS